MYSRRVVHTAAPGACEAAELLRLIAAPPRGCGPRKADKPLVLYGAGNLGRLAKSYLDRIGVAVVAVVDQKPEAHRNDPFWSGTTVLHPDEADHALRSSSLLAVSVCTAPFAPLEDELARQGWTDIVPFYDLAEAYRDRHPLSNGWFTGGLSAVESGDVAAVLSGWADHRSRAHHLQFLAWHGRREEWVFEDAPITTGDRYFIPEVTEVLRADESFLDLGAHHGEAALSFLERVGMNCARLWLFEPDQDNLARLRSRLEDALPPQLRERVEVRPQALGKSSGRRPFFGGIDYASQFSPLGSETVEVHTLDQLGLRPTFVKAHLEGWELDALKGGAGTLAAARPILAVTAYHNRLGLSELPGWLMRELPGYRFYFRLHSWCGTGAVIYGIPGEHCRQKEDL